VRAVAYIRVSDTSQVDGYSLDAQDRAFKDICRLKGWEAVQVYREEGKSAHVDAIKKRPVFRQMLEDAGKRQFDVVVVHTLDRWSRNLRVNLEALAILIQHNVGLVSISENIDYSTPQGKLATQMLGAFAEYFSASLGTHVKKGISERARQGKHLGGIPFGYEPCWHDVNGKRELRCAVEHPGGIHIHPEEGPAVTELFTRYAAGIATLAGLASWLNESGFRTRNMHKSLDANGQMVGGPRLFTTASIRVILHNAFYAGRVQHGKELLPGSHEALTSQAIFDTVQVTMKAHSGRSRTFQPHPQREYLLKGLVKCAYCRLPMWAQTYENGTRYYREHRNSRGLMDCPAGGGSIPCGEADAQIGALMEALILPDAWMDRVLAKIQMDGVVRDVQAERVQVDARLKRLGKTYVDGLVSDVDYERQKRALEEKLAGLVIPEVDAAKAAGQLLENLPALWKKATAEERRRLLLPMLESVYVDAKEEHRVVAIKPKPPFRPLFEIATTREGSGVILTNEAPARLDEADAGVMCSWWRRGGVEPPVQRTPKRDRYRLS